MAGQRGRPLFPAEIAQFSPPLRLAGTLGCVISPGTPVSFHDWVRCGGTTAKSRGKRAAQDDTVQSTAA